MPLLEVRGDPYKFAQGWDEDAAKYTADPGLSGPRL